MTLESLARPELIFCPLDARDEETVLRRLAARIAEQGFAVTGEELYAKLAERERLGSTGIGSGVAIPHCKISGVARPILAVGVVAAPGIDFKAVDDEPVRLFFVVISPEDAPADHLRVLAAISHWVKADRHVERLLQCPGAEGIYRLLSQGGGEGG